MKNFLENTKGKNKNKDTFVERMQLQVIRNLELSIRNIHIVYEDKSTKPNHPFAFGITINYISFHVMNFRFDWIFIFYFIRQQHLIGNQRYLKKIHH
jgi:hypothetical protein